MRDRSSRATSSRRYGSTRAIVRSVTAPPASFSIPVHVRRIEQRIGPGRILAERLRRALHRLGGSVGIAPRDLDIDGDAAPRPRHVGHLRDLAVRDDVKRARGVAQVDEAQRDVLDRALDGADANDVAERELVLELKEEARDEVAHEALRTERDGEPDDAGARQQWRDVEVELIEDHEQRRRQ